MDAAKIQRVWSIAKTLAVGCEMPVDDQGINLKEVERIIRSHESVEDAVTVLRYTAVDQDAEIVAFVTLSPLITGKQTKTKTSAGDDDEAQRVQFWDSYWEGYTYTAMDDLEPEAVGRDFIGWTSMYDGKNIDKGEMNEWLDETIATILHGGPSLHVLEIGTGSGMILFSLIGDIRSYVGIEMSGTAAEFVINTAESMLDYANKIHIYQGTAADLGSLDIPTSPDLVVINSVAQYFPSQDYLFQVIESVLRLQTVRTLFFGDVRSYALYDEFLLSKALHLMGETARKDELRAKMAAIAERELELLIDPAFFTALPNQFPGLIEHVEVLPKRIKATNELSCYRYAAVIHIKDRSQVAQPQEIHDVREDDWIDYVHQGLDREHLLRRLENASSVVAVCNIPNSKTVLESHVVNSLHESAENETSKDGDWLSLIRQDVQRYPSLSVLDLIDLGQHSGYRVELSWARHGSQRGGLDAIFHKKRPSDGQSRVMFRFPTDHESRESNTLTSQPLQLQAKQMIKEQLNESLQSKLPAHMIPEQIAIVEKMPLKQSGEVDRRALAERV
ncbi:enniatin synthetase [Xylariales sp. AK1849]|nr:enniatin synthetase [Xylariales sp. AK1849]